MTTVLEAPPVRPAPQPAPPRGSVRRLLRRAAKAQARAEELVAVVEQARAEVVAAFEAARDRQVFAATEKMPIETLKEVTDGRVRLTGLADQGLASVADVLAAGVARLEQIPGVGEASARRIAAAAEQLRDATRESLAFRIDLDPTNPENTRLLRALAVWAKVRPSAELASGTGGGGAPADEAADLAAQLAADRPIAAGARPIRRLFLGRRRRRAADEAVERIAAQVRRAQASGLLTAARDARRVTPPTAAQVWRDFEQQSAAYYGLLGQVVALGGDVAASEGYLPADIVERVNAQHLDTSKLRESLRLRGYQSFGARFALAQRRVILGDEMGLGKTVQAIAAMAHLAATSSTDRTAVGAGRPALPCFLVVCPASVLINWSREVAAHSTLPVVTLHGADRARAAGRWRRRGGVAITTFGSLGTLLRTPPRVALLVIDEAHYVKNPQAQRSRAVRRLADAAERVLFLSGTPMENRIEEFESLAAHLQPTVATAIRQYGALGVKAFRRAAAPVYLRRNQGDVLTELPELVQVDEWERFGPRDGAAYEAAVGGGNFMAMRRAAFAVDNPRDSAKLKRLLEIAGEALVNGRKVVVFSYFRDVLAIVASALGKRAYGPITGETSTIERQRIVDTFTKVKQPGVLVAQIEAGGVGLNIQAASVVILCEPQVKPSIEAQAIARAHRMGQVRSVQVHRLLTEGSVDARMLEMLDSKAKLFDAYVRHSAVAEAAPGAVDVSEVRMAREIVEQEQRRLAEAA